VTYPTARLDGRREDTVLVWAIIDAEGAVEETHVVEGTPEFGEAVEATLAATRFIPARDAGKTIRFYVTLEFEFRIEGPDTAPAANAAVRVSR
jgi:TonB family protein